MGLMDYLKRFAPYNRKSASEEGNYCSIIEFAEKAGLNREQANYCSDLESKIKESQEQPVLLLRENEQLDPIWPGRAASALIARRTRIHKRLRLGLISGETKFNPVSLTVSLPVKKYALLNMPGDHDDYWKLVNEPMRLDLMDILLYNEKHLERQAAHETLYSASRVLVGSKEVPQYFHTQGLHKKYEEGLRILR